jgi:type IX secretion system PorP/SprF family membrane protein
MSRLCTLIFRKKVFNKHLHIIFICLCFFSRLTAQEPQFTQFYASPLYLNPAFTGLTYEHRFALNYRNQWPGIKSAYQTYMASYDYNLSGLNSGIGGYILQDRAGTSNLVTTQGALNFAYRFKINKFSEVRTGISIAMTQKRLDFSTLIFNDQLVSGITTPVSQEGRNLEPINYMDLGGGALFNSTNYWLGVSAKHLNEPNSSMTGNMDALPIYLSVHGGYRYIISARGSNRSQLEEFISASVHFRKEQKFDQFDIGAYYFKSFMNVGIWYRGLPFKHYERGYPNRESLALLLGFEVPDKNFRVGYSYDLTISKLGINNTQGAHEISLVYEIAKKKKKNKRVLVSCPKF